VLNFALREVLGEDINQKGSLVAQEKLRFDFTLKSGIPIDKLEQVEEISTKYIRQNSVVYSKDVPLAIAEKIRGVRAVFGEKYPDPVRVVSIGIEVDEILSNVSDEKWKDVSIEFCGGTHVQKTGDIKDLVILEESAIAKGIRRIVAVTGSDAHEVQRIATEFSKRIDFFESSPAGSKKDAEMKSIQTDLNSLNISAVEKSRMKDRFTKLSKKMIDDAKQRQKSEVKLATAEVDKYFPKDSDKKFAVVELSSELDSKVMGDVMRHIMKSKQDKIVYVTIKPEEGEDARVIHACHVPEVSSNDPFLLNTKLYLAALTFDY